MDGAKERVDALKIQIRCRCAALMILTMVTDAQAVANVREKERAHLTDGAKDRVDALQEMLELCHQQLFPQIKLLRLCQLQLNL